ncbi:MULTISPECIES: alpha-hydroxy-acid oxidizing protein [Burkholderia cepacia complex]|uniref:alpha-hydroxy-acid oxidizing protein n=1 Tax=Burkholderia cepacia complex TaxID=87882 RepID=UPI0026DF83F8|nr:MULTISPECIES: alpha-hydroxy-acid oxidizing protein [Burkholderia cepacia complex]MDO5947023.1 alpha-hydroxy-acid oxidizing protein [Burkholderia cepacia]MDS0803640.1 alpha-hydroxy-acid oxidizing protein [Burkholderia cenocepacia]
MAARDAVRTSSRRFRSARRPCCSDARRSTGVSARGKAGVAHVLALLKAEMHTTMTLLGRTSVGNLNRECVQPSGAPVAEVD